MRFRIFISYLVVGLLFLGITGPANSRSAPDSEPETVVVEMVDEGSATWRFEPARVTVQPGDTLRFVQRDIVPHNVEFRSVPDAADLGEARMGPYLSAKGQTYELVIDERFGTGVYDYVCTPHAPMGMKGIIEVAALSSSTTASSR